MLYKELTINNPEGLKSRAAALFVQTASRYEAQILIECENKKVNAKSIMGIMAFNPSKGMTVNIITDGNDEEEALSAMEKFLVC